ncbi:MAG TPA: hypothetical protein VFI22_17620, partial [Thermomicrobiales bacterium]|nr:hypothetical protein [Thermomicrobiales bacterium]
MSAPNHDLNLGDLLAWEPRFVWIGEPPAGWRERAVSWAVVARAGAPMLPPLHGGEIVLLPQGALEASGTSWRGLGRELVSRDPAAVVVDKPFGSVAVTADAGMPLLALPGVALTSELESTLNRLLAERRGDLYRAGTELGRALTALAGREPDVDGVVEVASATTGLPLRVFDRAGRVLARRPQVDADESTPGEDSVLRPLMDGCRLVIGPVAPEGQAGARLVADRIVHALNDVLARAADLRPRGAARSAALAALLDGGGSAGEIEARARQIGLAVDATYRVALIHSGPLRAVPPDWLRAAGNVEPAGRVADADEFVLACRDRAGRCGRGRGEAGEALTA